MVIGCCVGTVAHENALVLDCRKLVPLQVIKFAVLSSVPVVGKVTPVAAVMVNVEANAPTVVRLPPSVIVLPLFATPVPPFAPLTGVESEKVLPVRPSPVPAAYVVADENCTQFSPVVPMVIGLAVFISHPEEAFTVPDDTNT